MIGFKPYWVEKISELQDVEFPVKWELEHYSKLLSMTDPEFEQYSKLETGLRKTLRTKLMAPAKAAAR